MRRQARSTAATRGRRARLGAEGRLCGEALMVARLTLQPTPRTPVLALESVARATASGDPFGRPPVLRDDMVFPDVVQSVGRTPLFELRRLDTAGAHIFVKMESRNPCGSVKDRVGAALVEDAERRGVLEPGSMLVEPTSGN